MRCKKDFLSTIKLRGLFLLIGILSVTSFGIAQFQRMAIPSGRYTISARGNEIVNAYCLDMYRQAPKYGMNYGNILSGGRDAIVRIGEGTGALKLTLTEAINKGHLEIRGSGLIRGSGKDMLGQYLNYLERSGDPENMLPILKRDYYNWEKLPDFNKNTYREEFHKIAQERGFHNELRFINKTGKSIEIEINRNLQCGDSYETSSVKGVDKLNLSRDFSEQQRIQKNVWEKYTTKEDVSIAPTNSRSIRESVERKKYPEELQKELKILNSYKGDSGGRANKSYEETRAAIKNFQKEHGISPSGEFDQSTKTAVKKEIKSLEIRLEYFGFNEGSIENRIKDFQKCVGLPRTGVADHKLRKSLSGSEFGKKLEYIGFHPKSFTQKILEYQKWKGIKTTGKIDRNLVDLVRRDVESGIYVTKGGNVLKTVQIDMPGGGKLRAIENRPNVFSRFSQRNIEKYNTINKVLDNRKYLQEEIEIISLVPDTDTTKLIKELFPKNHMSFNLKSMKKLRTRLLKNKRKSAFVLGHIERNAFVLRDAKGNIAGKIEIDELKKIFIDSGVNMFPIGCNSGFKSSSGVIGDFNSTDAVKRLSVAVKKNNTTGGMFESIAGKDFFILIDEIPFQDLGYIKAKIFKKNVKEGVLIGLVALAGTIYLLSELMEEEDDKNK